MKNAQMEECIRNCWECRDTCQDVLFNYGIRQNGETMTAEHIRLMTDCMQICQTSADFMRRNSPLHFALCRACAEVCEACAAACEKASKQNKIFARSADACRRCAESCRAMGSMKHAA